MVCFHAYLSFSSPCLSDTKVAKPEDALVTVGPRSFSSSFWYLQFVSCVCHFVSHFCGKVTKPENSNRPSQ